MLYLAIVASDKTNREGSEQRRKAQRDLIRDLQPITTELGAFTQQYSSDSAKLEVEIEESKSAVVAASDRADRLAAVHKARVEAWYDEIAKAEASEKPNMDYINSRYQFIAESQEACLEQEERLSESVDKVNKLLDQEQELKQVMKAQTKPLLSCITSLTGQLRNLNDEDRSINTVHEAERKAQILKLDAHRSYRSMLAKRLRGLIIKRLSVLKMFWIEWLNLL